MTAAERLIDSIPIPLEHRFFEAAGKRLHCVIAGSGPALVLVHGLNIGWGQWHAVLPELARRHTVFALDLTGAGDADKIDVMHADIAALARDALDGALRTLAPEGATVVGHSLGAWAALKLAAQGHPSVAAVAAVSPLGFTDVVPPRFLPLALRPVAELISATAMRPTRANLDSFLGDVMADRSAMSPLFVDYVTEHVTRPPLTHPLLLIHRLFRPFRIRPEFVLSPEELAAIRRPVLIAHGALDPLIPLAAAEPSFTRIPNAGISVLDGVGHVPPLERPAEFARLIGDFASSLPR